LCPQEDSQEDMEEHDMSEDTDSPPPETIAGNSNDVFNAKWWQGVEYKFHDPANPGSVVSSQSHPQASPPSPTHPDTEWPSQFSPWINSSSSHKIKPITVSSLTVDPISALQQQPTFDNESQSEPDKTQHKNVPFKQNEDN